MAAPFYVYDLLASETLARWGAANPLGTPVTVSYGFLTSTSEANFTPFTQTEMTATRNALAYISSFTNITFQETTGAGAQLAFGNADLTGIGPNVSGNTEYSYGSGGLQHASVYLANTGAASLAGSGFVPGSITANDVGGAGWQTLLHEIGHALGLKHPFETNIAGDPNSVLPSNLDDLSRSVMSYTAYQPSNVAVATDLGGGRYSYTYSNLDPQTYGLYDIAALQYLYGARSSSPGNRVFSFSPDAPVLETIYETGANATIDASALSGGNTIDLNPGATGTLAIAQPLRSGLSLPNRYDGTSALTIAYGSTIANAVGGAGADRITGNAIANRLDGGAGADTLAGGAGDDIYVVDSAGDQVIEAANGGYDRVLAKASYTLTAGQEIEALLADATSSTAPINLTGNEFANVLGGSAGANLLDGGAGADTMAGYGGDDIYIVDNPGDRVVESQGYGYDRVLARTSYALTNDQDIEALLADATTGTAPINLSGNTFANVLAGTYGANVLDGGDGADTLVGYAGDDTYVVDSAGDQVIEAANGGTDRVLAQHSYALGTGQSIEVLAASATSSTAAINLTGNEAANVILGSAGANLLDGRGGSDILQGYGGADSFRFSLTPGASAGVDRIVDFSHAEGDRILISGSDFGLGAGPLSANLFKDAAAAVEDGDDRVLYNHETGGLYLDRDGVGGADPVLFATLDTKPMLTAADFAVV